MKARSVSILSFAVVLTAHALAAGVSKQISSWSSNAQQQRRPFLSSSGFGGMCRGGLHIISAPLLVPYSLAFGVAAPFRTDPEMGGTTNYFLYAAAQTVVAPVLLTANAGTGAGGCCLETLSGLCDILTLGRFDLPERGTSETYDHRPYFIQFAERMGRARNSPVFPLLAGGKQAKRER